MAAPESRCLRCGTGIDARAIEGFCPSCLATVAFGQFDQGDTAPTGTMGVVRLGSYELLEEIGRGGMGVVYRARQFGLEREVAVKVMRQGPFADQQDVTRFRREAAAAAALRHPNIVAVYEVGQADGHAYFSMELVRGPTLAEMTRDGPLDSTRAARYLTAIALAVSVAHGQGILHRDLKPANVIIDADDQPRVTDFGLAKRLELGSGTVTQQLVGSPSYMPPEQADSRYGPLTVRSDVYSLGALLYHLLTGRPPFQGDTLGATLALVQTSEPVAPRLLNPGVPRDLETLCLKCLSKDPAARYPSAQQLADDLGRFLRHEPLLARPVTAIERVARWCRRQPVLAALMGSVAVLLVILAFGTPVAAWRIDRARRAEHAERAKAQQANRELAQANGQLAETVNFLEFQRAETFFRSGDASLGLAHLAALLRRDRTNLLAAERILSALLHRNWVLPSSPRLRHPAIVYSVAFSPDGHSVATGCRDGIARVWDLLAATEVVRLPHPDEVRDVCFSPDGGRIATACSDGSVRVWEASSGKLSVGPLLHASWALCVAFSPDGRWVTSGSGDGMVRVWDAADGALRLSIDAHHDEIWRAIFSPDGTLLATGSHDGSVRLWTSDTGQPFGSAMRHEGRVKGLAFNADGRRLASASRDRTVRFWDIPGCVPAGAPLRHPDGLNDVRFDPQGRWVVTAGFDNTARIWDAFAGELISQPFRHLEQVNQAAFSPRQRLLATAGEDWVVRFWNIQPGETLAEPMPHATATGEVAWLEFSPDGQRLASASTDGRVQIWHGRTGRSASPAFTHPAPARSACFSADGRLLMTAGADGWVRIWDVGAGGAHEFCFERGLQLALFSPDSQHVLTATAEGAVALRALASGRIVGAWHHDGAVTVARFSPDGRLVVTGSDDHQAQVWDVKRGRVLVSFVHLDKLRDACFSPDGRRVATASMDNTARLWDLQSGQPIGRVLQHVRTVESIRFDGEGGKVVTGSLDHSARIWDAQTGEPLTPPLNHDEGVTSACFSPDGLRVATSSTDRTARIWDAKTGLPLSDPLRHPGPVRLAVFSPDSTMLATGTSGPDNAAHLWEAPTVRAPMPPWLPDLAEAVAGLAVGPHGTTQPLADEALEQIRRRVSASTETDSASQVARWFFADRATRTTTPFQSETVAEHLGHHLPEGHFLP